MATIKEISELSGVSRGTVDRVLNGRGHVSPEKERLVKSIAKKLGYMPNKAGKGLAARKKPQTISVLLNSEGNPFFEDVIAGVKQAINEYRDFGIKLTLNTLKGYDVEEQLKALTSLGENCQALIFNPINDVAIAKKIDELINSGIAVFTINTDIADSKRICYIGSDYFEGGRIACGMLGLLTGGRANVGIITGSFHILGHKQRIEGFLDVMNKKYPGLKFVAITETEDDDRIAFINAGKMLDSHPEIDALFLAAAGVEGACAALEERRYHRKLQIISFDIIPTTKTLMQESLIQATICQQPFSQGYEAIKAAGDLLIGMITPEPRILVPNEVIILENLDNKN